MGREVALDSLRGNPETERRALVCRRSSAASMGHESTASQAEDLFQNPGAPG